MHLPGQDTHPLPCVGRDAELAELHRLYAQAAAEHATRVALVVGPPGIGKSRLCAELKRQLREGGVPVFEGRCREGGGAYQPVVEVLQSALAYLADAGAAGDRLAHAHELAAALRGHGRPAPGDAGAGRLQFFERVRVCLADVAALGRPPVVILHDVHLADGATADLFAYLLRTLAPLPGLGADDEVAGLLVATAPSDGAGAWQDAAAAVIALRELDRDGVRAFLATPHAVERLLRASGGLPGRLEALIAQQPPDAGTLAAARLAALTPEAILVARALAVYGRPAGPALLGRLAPREALVELAGSPLVERTVAGGELRLGLARRDERDAILAALDPDERAALHRTLGEHLQALLLAGHEGLDAAECAEHLLAGDAGERAVDAALLAGEPLELAYAYERAAALYARALEVTRRPEIAARLEERLAELYELGGDYGRALEAARARLVRHPEEPATLARIGRLHLLRGDVPAARDALDRARALAEARGADAVLVRLLADSAEAHFMAGAHEAALADGRLALVRAGDRPEAVRPRIAARNSMGKVLLEQGAYAEAARHFGANLDEARRASIGQEAARALINLGIAALRSGDHASAEAHYRDGLAAAEECGDVRHRAFCLQNLGVLAQWRRDHAAALGHYRAAAQAFRKLGHRPWLAWVALDLGDLYLGLGDPERAAAMADLSARLLGDAAPATAQVLLANLRGRIALERGELPAARERFEAALAAVTRLGNRDELALTLLHLARLELAYGAPDAALARLEALPAPTPARVAAQAALLRAEAQLARGEAAPLEAVRAELAEADRAFTAQGDDEGRLRASLLGAVAAERARDGRAARRLRDAARSLDAALRRRVPAEFAATYGRDPLRAALAPAPAAEPEPAEREPAPARPARRSAAEVAGIVGDHPRIRQVLEMAERVAAHDSLVLIRGESGTGKELVAEAIHELSARRGRPFVKVNCAALVDSLLLSELFGHERGAFTGAFARRKGRFEAADGGTIFLDEIGDISAKTQVALLRVLQTREFERVGGTQPIRVDVRIVCATNRDLEAMVADGRFREDLYYRLKGIEIQLPPLRERPNDIPALAEHFLARVAREQGGAPKRLGPAALDRLLRYHWPGNVRELENVMRSLSLFVDGDEIDVREMTEYVQLTDGPLALRGAAPQTVWHAGAAATGAVLPAATTGGAAGAAAAAAAGGSAADDLGDVYGRALASGLSLRELKRRIERECITRALADAGGNITRAAEILRMKRPRLSQLLKEHGIRVTGPNGHDGASGAGVAAATEEGR